MFLFVLIFTEFEILVKRIGGLETILICETINIILPGRDEQLDRRSKVSYASIDIDQKQSLANKIEHADC